MNRVVLIGRMVRDPELRFASGSGTAVTRFTLAVNRPRKQDGQQEADFVNCVSFGKIAETIAQYITKGRQLAVSGSIRTGSYENKEGQKVFTTDVHVDSFDFIDNSKDNFPREEKPSYDNNMEPVDDGDIPF